MNDDEIEVVVVASCLWPYEAQMMRGVLEMGGVQAFVQGALSTSGEIPGPVSSVAVAGADEARAKVLLAGVDATAEPFVCDACGETAPAGFSECPMCAEPVDPPDQSTGGWATWVVIGLGLLVAGYLCWRTLSG
jgi:hypothetical protein